tara:strand:+ start:419 stop:1300 length:882 start_codon:yes stop_codon:yes gene_type:complete
MKCNYCKKLVDGLPHKCNYCGKFHCSNHLLPENHDCKRLDKAKNKDSFSQNRSKKPDNLKNQSYVHQTYDFNDYDYSKNQKRIKHNKVRFNLDKIFHYLVIILFVASFISPILLFFVSPPMQDMQYVIGNPKPMYLYDIDPSCSQYESNIVSSLNHLSEKTGVKFVLLQNPLALLSGGMSFSCDSVMYNYGAVGEAESGFVGVGGFIVAWNNIRLSSVNQEVILHETLHVMGMGHSSDSTSIMYPYTNGRDVEDSLSQFITKYYINTLSYLNILPLNLLLALFLLIIFILAKR